MKFTMFLAQVFIGCIIYAVFLIPIYYLPSEVKWITLFFYAAEVFIVLTLWNKLDKYFNKKLEEIKRKEYLKGASDFLKAVSDDQRFKTDVNMSVPIYERGSRVGTDSTYGYLADFLRDWKQGKSA